MNDFIVEEGDAAGRARRRRQAMAAMPGISSRALEVSLNMIGKSAEQ